VSYGHAVCHITVITGATKVACIHFMKHKSETTIIMKDFVTDMELQHYKTEKVFGTDDGGEYVSKDI